MTQLKHDPVTNINSGDANWKALYRAGAVAPLFTLLFYLVQFPIMIFGAPYPTTVEGWFLMLQRSKILGLLYMNALDIFSIALLGIMFLALSKALQAENESLVTIAAYLAFVGVVTFIVPRVAGLSLLPLSDQYATATTDAQRETFLAAGESLSALGTATPETIGFFFTAVAGFIFSLIILQSGRFHRVIAYVGIFAFIVTVANDLCLLLMPSLAEVLMPVNGLLWLIWWVMISGSLLQLTRNNSLNRGN